MAGESATGIPASEAAPAEPGEPSALDLDALGAGDKPGKGGRTWADSERRLLKDWLARITAAQHAHYYLMSRYRRLNLWLGGTVVVLTTVVGTRLFASLGKGTAVPLGVRAFVASVSVLAAVLAGVTTSVESIPAIMTGGWRREVMNLRKAGLEIGRSAIKEFTFDEPQLEDVTEVGDAYEPVSSARTGGDRPVPPRASTPRR